MNAINSTIPSYVPPDLVFDFDLYNVPGVDDDYQLALKQLHYQNCPDIFWTPRNGGHWVVTRGEDMYQFFADHEHFSSHSLVVPKLAHEPLMPIFADPPQHAAYRALLAPAFSPKAVAGLEQKARALAIKLAEELQAKGECEFINDFAQHLPIEVFMGIVDLPAQDRKMLLGWADTMVRPETPEAPMQTIQKIFAYMSEKIAERRVHPGTDLISQLINGKVFDRPLTDSELVGMCSLVLVGGMDTVASAMGFAAHFLAKNPAHRQQLVDNPELISKAVDELLRRFPIVNQGREVKQDYQYKNIPFKQGDMIVMLTTLHGLDERKFADPLTVDFNRPTPIHSTFGNGPHRCPGSNLGRTELKVFMQEWLKRIPDFQVKPGDKAGMRSGVNGTIYRLPLVWNK
jgi:cytochrome P450